MSISAYPLAWPEGQPKTKDRKNANWSKRSSTDAGGYRAHRDITLTDAMQRLRDEFARMKVNFSDDVVVSKIRMAHRIKAMAMHPDVRGDDSGNMAEVNEARDNALRAIGAA